MALLLATLAIVVPVGVAQATSREQLGEAIKSYDALARIQDPARAGQRGDPDALRRWPDDSLQQVKPRTSELRRWRALLDSPPTDLDVEESLIRELLQTRIGSALEGTWS